MLCLIFLFLLDVNAKDAKGHTALHTAALLGFDQVVACLIEHKADLDAQDAEGYRS
jgi:ankyrin repeat protein